MGKNTLDDPHSVVTVRPAAKARTMTPTVVARLVARPVAIVVVRLVVVATVTLAVALRRVRVGK